MATKHCKHDPNQTYNDKSTKEATLILISHCCKVFAAKTSKSYVEWDVQTE